MAKLTSDERLALAVRVQVAITRAEAAQERSDAHKRHLFGAEAVRTRDAVADLVDAGLVAPGVIDYGKLLSTGPLRSGATRLELYAARDAALAASRAQAEAASAIELLVAAWRQDGRHVPTEIQPTELAAWIGVDVETYERAIQKALSAP